MKHPFARPMTEIFSRKVTTGPAEAEEPASVWEEYVRPVENILNALLVTNRLPGQEGLDLLIIGNDYQRKLTRWAELVEKKMGKPLNYAIMTREDYLYRKSVRDKFLADLWTLKISDKYDPEKIL
jgi:hypothetical protein